MAIMSYPGPTGATGPSGPRFDWNAMTAWLNRIGIEFENNWNVGESASPDVEATFSVSGQFQRFKFRRIK